MPELCIILSVAAPPMDAAYATTMLLLYARFIHSRHAVLLLPPLVALFIHMPSNLQRLFLPKGQVAALAMPVYKLIV